MFASIIHTRSEHKFAPDERYRAVYSAQRHKSEDQERQVDERLADLMQNDGVARRCQLNVALPTRRVRKKYNVFCVTIEQQRDPHSHKYGAGPQIPLVAHSDCNNMGCWI